MEVTSIIISKQTINHVLLIAFILIQSKLTMTNFAHGTYPPPTCWCSSLLNGQFGPTYTVFMGGRVTSCEEYEVACSFYCAEKIRQLITTNEGCQAMMDANQLTTPGLKRFMIEVDISTNRCLRDRALHQTIPDFVGLLCCKTVDLTKCEDTNFITSDLEGNPYKTELVTCPK